MEVTIPTLAQKLAIVNTMRATNDILKDLLLIQFKNNVNITASTVLADLEESGYPGYEQEPGWTGSPAYLGTDGAIHSTFPDVVFVAEAGQTQVTTATAAGTVTGSGNAEVIVTSAGMAGSPITLTVAVLDGDTPAVWAEKVRQAMRANAVIAARFNIGGAGDQIVLTRKAPAANDATLNVSLDNDTSTGITPAPTSAATRAGSTTGNNVDEVVYGWAFLNAAGDTLLYAAKLATPVALTAPGQGGVLEPDYVYPG